MIEFIVNTVEKKPDTDYSTLVKYVLEFGKRLNKLDSALIVFLQHEKTFLPGM